MKRLFTLVFVALFANVLFAQLPDGSIAPDFTMTDIDGIEHNLYTYLDSGYTVVVDFSAVWCGPCWSYHTSGALEDLYEDHGPAGMPGVSVNTTDDIMVFYIEGDQGTLDELNGGGSTQGDWVTGTHYPILPTVSPNSTKVVSDYSIGYFPTVYTICPDRLIQESGQISTTAHYALAQRDCPPVSNNENDVRILDLSSPIGTYCVNSFVPEITVQNMGQIALSSLDVVSYIDEVAVDTFLWTGELDRFNLATIALDEIMNVDYGTYKYEAVLMNPNGFPDEDPMNDSVSSDFIIVEDGGTVVVRLKTDNYPSETSWDLKYGDMVIAKGDGYTGSSTVYNIDVCVMKEECYTFTIYDEYGDGVPGGYAKVIYNDIVVVDIVGGSIGSSKSEAFCTSEILLEGTDFLSYEVDFADEIEINAVDHEILVVTYSNITEPFVADFTLSSMAVAYVGGIEQISGESANSFTNDVLIYTVIAENGDSQEWIVVYEERTLSKENDFLSYTIEDVMGIIDSVKHEISVSFYYVKNSFVPEFTVSEKATVFIGDKEQVSGENEIEFINDTIVYTVIAENGDSQEWIVAIDIQGSILTIDDNAVQVYPNPTNGVINIEGVEGAKLEVYNALGEIVQIIGTSKQTEVINMDNYVYGIYFVKIIKGNETNMVRFIYSE